MENFAAEEEGEGAPVLFAQVMVAFAASEFLTTTELGRLLLLTSKELTASAFPSKDEFWASLCHSRWGIPYGGDILKTMLAEPTPFSSPEQCFRHMNAGATPPTRDVRTPDSSASQIAAPPQMEVPRALRYSPEDYMIIITVCKSRNLQPIFGMALRGQQIPEFFETGKTYFVSNHFYGCIKNAFDENGELVPRSENEWYKLINDIQVEVKVTIIRIPDQRSIDLVDASSKDNGLRLFQPSRSGENKWSFPVSAPPYPRMNHDYGRALFAHCFPANGGDEDQDAENDDSDGADDVEDEGDDRVVRRHDAAYGQILFTAFTEFHLTASGEEGNLDATIGLSGIKLNTRFNSFEFGFFMSSPEDDTHRYFYGQERDVTFAHFLEGLDDWFIP